MHASRRREREAKRRTLELRKVRVGGKKKKKKKDLLPAPPPLGYSFLLLQRRLKGGEGRFWGSGKRPSFHLADREPRAHKLSKWDFAIWERREGVRGLLRLGRFDPFRFPLS